MSGNRTNPAGKLPNVVLIVLDSVRRDHLSCSGYQRQTTPNIDRLAAGGTLFEHAYANSCWTIPSHASLFTGLYPSEHGVNIDRSMFAPGQETLAARLSARGYQTACISCNSFAAGKGTNLNLGFDLTVDVGGGYQDGSGLADRAVRFAQRRWREFTQRDRGAARATRLAKEWTGRQAGPFFLFMNYMDCHLPYRLKRPQRFRFVPPVERGRVARIPQDPFAVMAGELELTPREVAGIRALYDGSLFYLDQQVGQLVDHLEQMGVFDQTIFLVTSDHGESFGEHGLFDHQYGLYEHQLRVPLVAHFPNGSLARTKIDGMIQLGDLLPVLDRLLSEPGGGLAPQDYEFLTRPLRGAVMAEYLVPNLNAFRRRFPSADVARYESPLRAVRSGEYKLICAPDGDRALYNLAKDPCEEVDISAAQPAKAAELEGLLFDRLGPWPGSQRPTANLPLEADLKERLEAMGYL